MREFRLGVASHLRDAVVPPDEPLVHVERVEEVLLVVEQALDERAFVSKLLFVLSALGHVACDLREPLERPRLVSDGGDGDVRPEQRAVAADAPVLVLDRTVPGCVREVPLGDPVGAVRLGVERGEVLPDDLVGVVALDAFDTRIPRLDDALRVEGEDGVLLDGGDERLELRLGLGSVGGRPPTRPSGGRRGRRAPPHTRVRPDLLGGESVSLDEPFQPLVGAPPSQPESVGDLGRGPRFSRLVEEGERLPETLRQRVGTHYPE